MNSFWFFLDKVQDYMKKGAAACIVVMAAITCSDIFLRAALNYPIFGSEELVSIFAILAMGLSLPYSHKQGVHIGVEIITRLFSKKSQAIIHFITNTLSAILMTIISWRIFIFAQVGSQSGENSMNLQIPMYYFAYILSVCFFIFSLFIVKDLFLFFTETNEMRAVVNNKQETNKLDNNKIEIKKLGDNNKR
ncbi:MAG: TRAP transporter small permease [Desulfamplus sp.]|nr:TRAP transporter small permease [Desulfamplus sp.]